MRPLRAIRPKLPGGFRTGDPFPPESFTTRFWRKIQIQPGEDEGQTCWIWTGACSRKSHGAYGVIRGTVERPGMLSASRVMLFLHTGDAGEGREACHRDGCTDTRCVNPAHLYWGTRRENYYDNERRYGRAPTNGHFGRRRGHGAIHE